MEFVLGLDRAHTLAALREPIGNDARARYEQLTARRAEHEPLQYIVGRAHFLDFEVAVRPGVFIPRPETELLVEAAQAAWSEREGPALDVCTGSGAIAIAIARGRPQGRVIATDLSPHALAAARENAVRLEVADRMDLVRSDLLSAFRLTTPTAIGVLVCNPPYAAEADVTQPEVRDHEPRLAWTSGPTGLEIYSALIPQASELLAAGTTMLLELGYGQQEAVAQMLANAAGWSEPRVEPDFQGIPRVLATTRI